jgi:hypothetical protein
LSSHNVVSVREPSANQCRFNEDMVRVIGLSRMFNSPAAANLICFVHDCSVFYVADLPLSLNARFPRI